MQIAGRPAICGSRSGSPADGRIAPAAGNRQGVRLFSELDTEAEDIKGDA